MPNDMVDRGWHCAGYNICSALAGLRPGQFLHTADRPIRSSFGHSAYTYQIPPALGIVDPSTDLYHRI